MASSDWWASLRHGGLLITPGRLAEFFPGVPHALPGWVAERLRRDVTRVDAGIADAARDLIATVLERVVGLNEAPPARWLRGADVPSEWSHRALTGEVVRPRRLWQGPRGGLLPVFIDDEARLGVGRGRRAASRVVEWLRRAGLPLALLTNARQWRLIHAGLDYDAWAECDTALWFEEGLPAPQVDALRILLSPTALTPVKAGEPSPLAAAILESRRGQAELSGALGERVRIAIERLIQAHGAALATLEVSVTPREIYIAATRMIMRMIVVLFAEARELLPRENAVYQGSYGLEGLREALERAGSGAAAQRLQHRAGAWPRVLALLRLVFGGSHHPALPILAYGGGLFAPGSKASPDPVLRALAIFEDPENAPSDADVREILGLLCRTWARVRQGARTVSVLAPVDFSDLSSEYIGILYEGLLDYELRRASGDDPYVFLALGDEPVLPLSRLEGMDDGALESLVDKLRQKKRLVPTEDASGEDEEEQSAEDEAEPDIEGEPPAEVPLADEITVAEVGDQRQAVRDRARAWAARAVVAGGLVRRPRGRQAAALRAYEEAVAASARGLVGRIVLPGEWFLVRWGGTRKGTGTFYTRPQLAVPTVQRTLRPLAWDPPVASDGRADEDAPVATWTPKTPEQILALKVCDPAMGSASFLVASLRFLAEAIFASLFHHEWLRREGDRLVATGNGERPPWFVEAVCDMPLEVEEAERHLRARLKRHVVERCLYGVDFDLLAVELGRLALWVETMDRSLPFEFLDHKLKVGNALIGCWFDHFRDYPALAWEREGGDKDHERFVHHFREETTTRGRHRGTHRRSGDVWSHAIERFKAEHVRRALADWISGQTSLFAEIEGQAPEALHDEAVKLFEAMHILPIHEPDARAAFYREKLLGSPAFARLREAFDTWCALWFWPADELDLTPLPQSLENPLPAARTLVQALAQEYRFFHWEVEFPEVFAAPGGGFNAIVGNPPWEIQKPNSKEFFSNHDPLYRSYGKQQALGKQREYFTTDARVEREWLQYCARFKALANWNRNAAHPFGDGLGEGGKFNLGPGSAQLHAAWRARRLGRPGYADATHPFCYQGSADINTYKMFLEQAHALLQPGGQLGLIVPSGVYTDKGTTELRTLFLLLCRWRWLFGLINWTKIFGSIYYRFKFCIVIVQKGDSTYAIRSAFSRYHLRDWEQAERHVIPYTSTRVERFSPRTRAILEVRERRDLEVLEKMYSNAVLLGDDGADGWGIDYAREFDMTNDSKLFPPRPEWEARGYRPDQYGRWLKFRRSTTDGRHATEAGFIRLADHSAFVHEDDIEDVALPLHEGRMIGQFDFSQKGWVSGKGRRAVWREIPWEAKVIEPQYLIGLSDKQAELADKHLPISRRRLAFMDVTSATNARTMIATILDDGACGNSAPVLVPRASEAALCAVLNSLVFDYQARARCGGLHLNYFVIEETALPVPPRVSQALETFSLRLACASHLAAVPWWRWRMRLGKTAPGWRSLWAVTPHERLRVRCLLDALAAEAYGLDLDDLGWILRECDHPKDSVGDSGVMRTLDPKGFWRVDKDREPEFRQTVLALVAYAELNDVIRAHGGDRDRGIEAFCAQNDGDGWMLPETLRLADFGLGHDERAKEPQSVRERMGPRFVPWQIDQPVEESWAECERHARNILGPEGFAALQAELRGETPMPGKPPLLKVAEAPQTYGAGAAGAQRRLFPGEATLFGETFEDPPPRPKRGRR